MKAKSETRGRMVAGAADLIRRRGANATSVREVVRYTQSPRGSITHHFPGGREQLVEEAVRYAGREVSDALRQQVAQLGLLAGLGAFLKMWRGVLQSTQFEAGCPVLTVSVEQYAGDDNAPDPVVQERLLDLTHEIFTEWQQILSSAMQGEGFPPGTRKTPCTARGLLDRGHRRALSGQPQHRSTHGCPGRADRRSGIGTGCLVW